MTHTNRRKVLGSIGIGLALTTGCIGGPNENQTATVVSDQEVSSEEFRRVSGEGSKDNGDAVVTEVPNVDAIYIYRTLQLPTPSHTPSHEVMSGESNSGITLQYTAESNLGDNQSARSVIQPTPYTVKIQLKELYRGINITITTLSGTEIRYQTTNTDSTTPISQDN